MEQIGSWKQGGQTVLDLNTTTTERDEYSGNIAAVQRGDDGDYTFSFYRIAELSDDGYLTEIEGGIIDSGGQDYSYVFVQSEHPEGTSMDCPAILTWNTTGQDGNMKGCVAQDVSAP
jgi:hypothetical protein